LATLSTLTHTPYPTARGTYESFTFHLFSLIYLSLIKLNWIQFNKIFTNLEPLYFW